MDAKESREQNASVRARAGNPVFGREHEPIRQTVLALEWVMESFIRGEAAPEDEFEIRDEEPEQVEEAREEEGSGEAEQSDEDDELDERGHRPSDYVFPAYASRGGWLHSEEEELAKFLATNPQDKDKEDGGSIWDQYACKVSRTAQPTGSSTCISLTLSGLVLRLEESEANQLRLLQTLRQEKAGD